MNKRGASFSTIVAVIGAILISVGFAWLLADNWHSIPAPLKIFILLGLTFAAYVGGIVLKEKEYLKTAKSLFVLGALIYTLSIFLIAQIFSTSSNLQNYAWLFLLAWVGVALSAYLFDSPVSLFITLIEFLIWLTIQFTALIKSDHEFSFILFALLFLVAGIFFYGLSLFHRARQHSFARLFQWWTAFYFLVFTYILTFQMIIPKLWGGEVSFSQPTIFLIAFGALSLLTCFAGILFSFREDVISNKEILAVIGIIILLISLLLLTNLSSEVLGTCSSKQCYDFPTQDKCEKSPEKLDCAWGWNGAENQCQTKGCWQFKEESLCTASDNCRWQEEGEYGYTGCTNKEWGITDSVYNKNNAICSPYHNKKSECLANTVCIWNPGDNYGGWFGFGGRKTVEMPAILLFTWILINVFFIFLILAVIGFGSLNNFPALINLGILFFALDIFSRYIGFVMDLWGYNILPFIFITGGILLVGGGWLIEKWRRGLVNEIRGTVR